MKTDQILDKPTNIIKLILHQKILKKEVYI